MKVVIIDNYDSFTYNLAHLVNELGADVTVFRNDQFQLPELECFDKIILSPGPGIPSEAGLLMDVIRKYAGRKPMLGVCLGHQAIGEAFGAKLTNLSEVYHGVATPCTQFGNDVIFDGLDKRIEIGRYHSWVVDSYIILAFSPTAIILSVRRSRATTEGSSTTILSSLIMMVLAVPKSIAIS